MGEIQRMAQLVFRPRQCMPVFFDHPTAVHRNFARGILPLVGVRSVAIFVRSLVEDAAAAGLVMSLMALLLQLLTWACFGWALVGLAQLCGFAAHKRQAFALSTAVSAPLWLAGIFYLIPEDPPALYRVARLTICACGAWGIVMLAYAPFFQAMHMRKKRAVFVALAGASYVGIYGLFFVTTGLIATLLTLMWRAS